MNMNRDVITGDGKSWDDFSDCYVSTSRGELMVGIGLSDLWGEQVDCVYDWRAEACRQRAEAEAARREALGRDGRAWEDYARRWAQMQRGR